MVSLAGNGMRGSPLAPLLVGLAHFIAAAASLALTRWSSGLATLWLPNAVLLAYLLTIDRAQWRAAVIAVLISGSLANWLGGAPVPVAALFGATNGLEPLAIALVLSRGGNAVDLERVDDLLRFVAAALGATMATATLAGAAAAAYGMSFEDVWVSWFCSSYLGLLIATPLLLVALKQLKAPRLSARDMRDGVLIMGLVAAFGAFALLQTNWPFFFMVLPPIVVATFRLRALGAAASVLVLAILGTAAVVQGQGPFALTGASFGEQLAMLQLFLAVAILTALPVAAILSQRDRIARDLAQREEQLASIVDAVSDVIFRTDHEGRWTYLNPAWEHLTGYAVEEAIGRSVLDHVEEEDREPLVERLRGLNLGLFDSVRHQFRFRTARGDHRWGEVQARRLLGPQGEMIGAAGIIVDISDRLAVAALADDARRRAEQEAEAALLLAATDELTGVASRRAFLAVLDQQLATAQPLALALFDVDHFKRVNDRYGHETGDQVLRSIAAIAEACLRDRDLVGRLGGEEFAMLMPGASLEQAYTIGERVRLACAAAEHEGGLSVTVSIGVTATEGRVEAAELLRQADAALYRAKFDGRNCLRLAA
jgi:diguanylate cyclase (GGDEF)-like protein/PAS domain S-box-containing protein